MYKLYPVHTNTLLVVADIETILANLALHNSQRILTKMNKGRVACRLLLQQLFFPIINQNNLSSNQQFIQAFDENDFPYKLKILKNSTNLEPQIYQFIQNIKTKEFLQNNQEQNLQCFVSFSHSQKHIAILLSTSPQLGVDIEDKSVSKVVCHRYFVATEIDWLNILPFEQQALGRKLLWTLKESLIKAQSSADSQLIAGLKVNLTEDLTWEQMTYLLTFQEQTFNVITVYQHGKQQVFGFAPMHQCGFYIFSHG